MFSFLFFKWANDEVRGKVRTYDVNNATGTVRKKVNFHLGFMRNTIRIKI